MTETMKPGRRLVALGATSCSERDLLAILIGSGGRGYSAEDVADDLLRRFGTLANLMGAPLDELAGIRGLGPVRAIRIAAAYELATRIVGHLERNG